MQRSWIAVSEVAEKIRLDVPFRKEFLIAAETGLARGKEFLVHLGVIESGHWPAIEAERARSHDQVCALETRIPFRVISTISGLFSKSFAIPGFCGKSFGSRS